MSKMLVINAHPQVESQQSISLLVLNHFLSIYKQLNPTETVEQVNLYGEQIPVVDHTVLSASDKLRKGEPLTDAEQQVTDRRNEILKQFKDSTKYVIAMPLHNFNIPSKLKDYMDTIIIPRETYKFTENGSVGLLYDGRSMLVIQGSGSVYTNDDWYTEVEYSHKYLKSMFNFLGIEDYQIIRAQGTAILKWEEILDKAYREAGEAARRLTAVNHKVTD
ncbi:FMN-dependent NADH-azoreductase [Paenibacillus sp. Root444D2]|uniref:FMN-dependent NADH-azoreductase n=1 Tax=Paenibacillus sp. Root444D2 TaxID=1736538 RepID=UPI00070DA82B|nr:NAD(P)H-dependent oxidoreductase [Paenibacillus sp. Root444D2]KQX48659.1 FMN-dependent NADH-azoreductase [Paenibacillus sp. Root444D2]